jgi:hypothetical protein
VGLSESGRCTGIIEGEEMKKDIGKIQKVFFGKCGYDEAGIGISFILGGAGGWGYSSKKGGAEGASHIFSAPLGEP